MPKHKKTNLLVYHINTTKQNCYEFFVCRAVKHKLKLLAKSRPIKTIKSIIISSILIIYLFVAH